MLGDVLCDERDSDDQGINESEFSFTSGSCFDISSDGSIINSDEERKIGSPHSIR